MKTLALALAVCAAGCHARLRRALPGIDVAQVQVFTIGGPVVRLGPERGHDALEASSDDIAQELATFALTSRIRDAVDVPGVHVALARGFRETLGDGPPFGSTERTAGTARVQLQVLAYGLYARSTEDPARLTFTVRARVYRADGQRVYRRRMTCTAPTTTGEEDVESLSDEAINARFLDIARTCGGRFVEQLRRDAGS